MNSKKAPLKVYKVTLKFLLEKIDSLYLCPDCRKRNWYCSQLLMQSHHSNIRKEQRDWMSMINTAIPNETSIIGLVESSHEDMDEIYKQCSKRNCEGVKRIVQGYISRIARFSKYNFKDSETKDIFSVLKSKDLKSSLDRFVSEERKLISEKSLA